MPWPQNAKHCLGCNLPPYHIDGAAGGEGLDGGALINAQVMSRGWTKNARGISIELLEAIRNHRDLILPAGDGRPTAYFYLDAHEIRRCDSGPQVAMDLLATNAGATRV